MLVIGIVPSFVLLRSTGIKVKFEGKPVFSRWNAHCVYMKLGPINQPWTYGRCLIGTRCCHAGFSFFGSDTIGQMFETIRPGSSLRIIYFSLNIFKFKTTNKSKQRHVASYSWERIICFALACSIFSIDRENTMNDKSALKPAIFLHSAHLKYHQRDVLSHFKFMYQIHAT